MEIVERIQQLAAEQNTNLKKIEQSVGLGNGTIRRWEQSSPSVEKLSKVANFLHTTVGFLVDGNDKIANNESNVILNTNDQELLGLFHQLPERNQIKLIGYVERLVEENNSVAADDSLQEASGN